MLTSQAAVDCSSSFDWCCMQFVKTMEANILAEIKAVVSVVITQIVPGSVKVSSSIVFTGADSTAALAGASAVAAVLASGDVSTIVGTSFGTVDVSGVTQGNATNPSKSRHSPMRPDLMYSSDLPHVLLCMQLACLPGPMRVQSGNFVQ